MHMLKTLRDMWASLDQRGRYIMMFVGAALIVLAFFYGVADVLLGLL